jgi:hypothetical protein
MPKRGFELENNQEATSDAEKRRKITVFGHPWPTLLGGR